MDVMDSMSLQALLDKAIEKHDCPGASMAVWHSGELITAVSGFLDSEEPRPVQRDSVFQIGSITKVFTATLVMQLVDQGKVDLDATVRTYLPDFRVADADASRSITVRQLLTHTSGMDGDMMTDTGMGPDRLARYIDRVALLPQSFPPGEGFSYSNSALCLAGRIAEVVTGLGYDQLLKDFLFTPLGMKTAISAPEDFADSDVSSGHDPSAEGPQRLDTIFTLPFATAPAGSTPSMSAADLVKFVRMHLDGGVSDVGKRVLSEAACVLMQETQVAVPVPARDIAEWGLGWFILLPEGGRVFGHDGATVGQSAYLRIHPETDTVVALLTNVSGANALAAEVLAQTFEPLTGTSPTPSPAPVSTEGVDLSIYAGRYRSVGGVQKVTVEGDSLRIRGAFKIDDEELMATDLLLSYGGDGRFLAAGNDESYMLTHSFMGEDKGGLPQVLFTGLRVYRRCHETDDSQE
ncbi:MAG: serine hydrolase domain-containing protein [Pseudomonadota bacterium]